MVVDKKAILINAVLGDISLPQKQRAVIADKLYFIQDPELIDIIYQAATTTDKSKSLQGIIQKINTVYTRLQKVKGNINQIKDQQEAQQFLNNNLLNI